MRFLTTVALVCFGCSNVFGVIWTENFTAPADIGNPNFADSREINSRFFGLSNPTTNPTLVSGFTFTDTQGVTVTYDLRFDVSWIGDASGLTGVPSDANNGLGVDTSGTTDPDARLNDLDNGGAEALEALTISVVNINATTGATNGVVNSVSFDNPTTTSAFVNTATGATLAVNAISGTVGGKLTSFDIDFDVTAVPEPSSWAMLGLVGLFTCGRSWLRKRSA